MLHTRLQEGNSTPFPLAMAENNKNELDVVIYDTQRTSFYGKHGPTLHRWALLYIVAPV